MKKEVVILACSKSKIWKDKNFKEEYVQAKKAYTGKVFESGKKYAEKKGIPYYILSAAYGLIEPNKLIKNYNQKLGNKGLALKKKDEFFDKISQLFQKYDRVFLIGGNQFYRLVFQGFDDNKFDYIKCKNQADQRKKAKELAQNG